MRADRNTWSKLVADYEAAWAASDAALEAYDDAMGSEISEAKEAEYERLRDIAFESEDRLLQMVAPDLPGVAVQLKILGSRHFSADLGDDPMPSEDRDAAGLRNVYAAVLKAASASESGPT